MTALPLAPNPSELTGWTPSPIRGTGRPAGKAIVICCDGTSNSRDQMVDGKLAPTNVFRLYQALSDETQFQGTQITWYDEGVGTGTSSQSKRFTFLAKAASAIVSALPKSIPDAVNKAITLIEAATGSSIQENIVQGYREIVRNYEPGDRIYIFGFSRGAYTARCIAGVIQRCGLLTHDNIRYAADAVTVYRRRYKDQPQPLADPQLIHDPMSVKVHVLGLWDTVASLGLPLWGWWFRVGALWRSLSLNTEPAEVCEYVYHAMAMDERRSQFFPTVVSPPKEGDAKIRQFWFRGAHADIGGGYKERELGDVTLEWMLQIAHHHGLQLLDKSQLKERGIGGIEFRDGPGGAVPYCPGADEFGEIHDELKRAPTWNAFGSWPRWYPLPRPGSGEPRDKPTTFGTPHLSVYARAARAAWQWRQRLRATPLAPDPLIDTTMARDGMLFLDPGERVRVHLAANRVWNRTGVVFEKLAVYRIVYLKGGWRDADAGPCGADGQDTGVLDLRHYWPKRLPTGKWMELVGHVAHPRYWPLAELEFRVLVKLLLFRDPKPLVRSLIPIGRHVVSTQVVVRDGKECADSTAQRDLYVVTSDYTGMFYAFANDWWGTYDNNSGEVEVLIERVEAVPDGATGYRITSRGEVAPLDIPRLRAAQAAVAGAAADQPRIEGWPARGQWFGVPSDAEIAGGPAFSPQGWRDAAAAEQAAQPGLAFPDTVVAAWDAPPEPFLARRPRSLMAAAIEYVNQNDYVERKPTLTDRLAAAALTAVTRLLDWTMTKTIGTRAPADGPGTFRFEAPAAQRVSNKKWTRDEI